MDEGGRVGRLGRTAGMDGEGGLDRGREGQMDSRDGRGDGGMVGEGRNGWREVWGREGEAGQRERTYVNDILRDDASLDIFKLFFNRLRMGKHLVSNKLIYSISGFRIKFYLLLSWIGW